MKLEVYDLKHPENNELVNTINVFSTAIGKLNDDDLLDFLPIAYFKIFVKFQFLVIQLFKRYCQGIASTAGYLPERRHSFDDETELRAFCKFQKSDYIDYDNRIDELSKYIFVDDPFSKLNLTVPLNYANMKNVRNYIAHESDESKSKLLDMKILTSEQTLGYYFMKKSKHTSKINYKAVIESIYDMSNYLIEGN